MHMAAVFLRRYIAAGQPARTDTAYGRAGVRKEKKMKKMKKKLLQVLIPAALAAAFLTGCGDKAAAGNGTEGTEGKGGKAEAAEITNVSYDPTRELYAAYNELFQDYWKDKTGQDITIVQSHGGSGKQALEVANGLEADVVTLALEGDVQAVADAGLIEEGFTKEFERDSSPYTSTIVFLVRKGNEKKIYDWDDLLRDEVGIITPNPKTSGGARWNYLAAWYYFEKKGLGEDEILKNMETLYKNVLVLDSGARGATTSFVENGQGDVLIAWENEAFLSLEEYPDEYEIVVPSVSILCQPTVAIVDKVVDARGTRDVAEEYLSYLYSKDAQRVEAKNFYRPSDAEVLEEYTYAEEGNTVTELPEDGKWINTNIDLTDIGHFGGWAKATERHFVDGALFDSIYEEKQ